MNKVLHLINDSSVERGGAQKILAKINSIESDVSKLQYKVFSKSWIKNSNSQHQRCGGKLWFIDLLILFTSFAPKLIVIHSRCYLPFVYLFRAFNTKVVFYCHADYRKKQVLFRVFKCDYYVAVSDSVRESLSQSVTSPVTVITNPVDSQVKVSTEVTTALIFNYVGALQEWKGIDRLIHFLKQFCQDSSSPAVLNIVGDGPLAGVIESQLENDFLKINMFGYQSAPYACLKQGAIQVIPSLEEGFGMVAVEALLNGSPVLYSNVAALSEILVEDNFSKGFDIYEFESFQNALKSLLIGLQGASNSSDLLVERSSLARRKYGYSSFKSKYVGMINKLL